MAMIFGRFGLRVKWVAVLLPLVTVAFIFQSCKSAKPVANQVSRGDDEIEKLSQFREAIRPFFQPMRVVEGDWLKSFPEEGQTFDEYRAANALKLESTQNAIDVLPVGKISDREQIAVEAAAEYLQAFYGLRTRLKPSIQLTSIPANYKRAHPTEGRVQLKTDYFLNELLPKRKEPDSAALIAFTSFDLYPGEDWNYVFGMASLDRGIGVWSLARMGDDSGPSPDNNRFVSRILKLAVHETGHMFGMRHCTKYECVMSGTNHLGETDRRPLDTCPECTAKIVWKLKYPASERYRRLEDVSLKLGFESESRLFAEKYQAVREIEVNPVRR